ncbi:TRAP transporter small permease [Qingshengfaniella alkalisoli]|uniref:TRAP transporter small permease protein n=1 Tax=Qingshengfaniella alkalisoli TaxID=2599296 RepID=A0A5B8J1F1_9RHOB|nr:TRAP transporter small permease [Qingshengfaniella alkalisoli]QDY70648.1 TRAP transporter small permease [Qingshengfaniella alkalisoli]
MTQTRDTDEDEDVGALDTGIRLLNKGFVICAAVALILMMLHVTLDVAARATGTVNLIGTLEIVSYYYMILLVMLPMGYVELKHEHIRVDLFVQMMPNWLQFALYLLSCLLGLIFFGMMLRQSILDAWTSTTRQETIMSNFIFYIWPSRWALPLGFAGILLAVLANLLKAIRYRKAL